MATPRASRRKLAFALVGVLVVLALAVAVVAAVRSGGEPTADESPSAGVTASGPSPTVATTYRFSGSGRAVVSWAYGDFSYQETNASLPWSTTIARGSGPVTAMTAQRKSGDSGGIECDVLQGGRVVAMSSATGPNATVACPAV